MTPGVMLSAVIVNYEGGTYLTRCVRSLLSQGEPMQVIVVDNGSADGSVKQVEAEFPDVEIVRPDQNLGFAGGVNAGAAAAHGEYLLLLNPDVELLPGCANSLVRELAKPEVGVVGPVTDLLAASAVEYGATIDPLGHPVELRAPGLPLYVSGAALATRTDVFKAIGGFDDRLFLFMEDVDYCWRVLLAGLDVVVAVDGRVVHVGGATIPGGYERDGGFETSRFRIALRERNTLAMLIKCYGGWSLCLAIPGYLLQSLAVGAALALSGRLKTARDILTGLAWNVVELPRTLSLRRSAQGRRQVSDRVIRARMFRSSRKLQLLLQYGVPRVHE
jgi:GT2 family glycosyltransferase